MLEGELEMFAFEPVDRSIPDWHEWRSTTGENIMRGGPGMFMFVPENCPHAFGNPTDQPARVFFQSSVPGVTRTISRSSPPCCARATDDPTPRRARVCAGAGTSSSSRRSATAAAPSTWRPTCKDRGMAAATTLVSHAVVRTPCPGGKAPSPGEARR